MSIKNKLAAVACGLALVGTVAAPVAALAAQNETPAGNIGTTEVTLMNYRGESGTDADQLHFSVPTVIPFAVKSNGSMQCASADAIQIENLSVFPIHIANIAVKAQDPFVVADTLASDVKENTLDFALDGIKASAATAPGGTAYAKVTLGYQGSATANHDVAVTDGKIVKVTEDLSNHTNPQKAATITWTLAAGDAQ